MPVHFRCPPGGDSLTAFGRGPAKAGHYVRPVIRTCVRPVIGGVRLQPDPTDVENGAPTCSLAIGFGPDIDFPIVALLGMSSLGPLAYRTPGNPWDTDRSVGNSEATAQRVDEEVRELIMRGYETARQVVAKHRDAVRAMAEELLQVESLDADAIKAIPVSAA